MHSRYFQQVKTKKYWVLLWEPFKIFAYSIDFWDVDRRKRTDQLNHWLQGWHCAQGFGFCGPGHTFNRPDMLSWLGCSDQEGQEHMRQQNGCAYHQGFELDLMGEVDQCSVSRARERCQFRKQQGKSQGNWDGLLQEGNTTAQLKCLYTVHAAW